MFYDEIFAGKKGVLPKFLCLLSEGKVWLEGKFRVEYFGSTKIVLSFGKERLFVFGQNLDLEEMSPSQMVVAGKIFGVTTREAKFETI